MTEPIDRTITARDGTELQATVFPGPPSVMLVNAAMAVPARFYRHFATGLQRHFTVVTWDYRDIGRSRHGPLRDSTTTITDWATVDLPSVIDWAHTELSPDTLSLIGHSLGGQVAGLIDNPERVHAMVTVSAQSGHWRLQGGEQKALVAIHGYLTLPLLTAVVGYMPWSKAGGAEDLPPRVAVDWARWVRDRRYLLGDASLPLDRYAGFVAPVLAYSVDDDAWGTRQAVDAMMSAYPNVERRHIAPSDHGVGAIGHMGYFRPASSGLWPEIVEWLTARS